MKDLVAGSTSALVEAGLLTIFFFLPSVRVIQGAFLVLGLVTLGFAGKTTVRATKLLRFQ